MRDIVLENMEALGKTNRRQPNLLSSKGQIGWSSREARKLSIKEWESLKFSFELD